MERFICCYPARQRDEGRQSHTVTFPRDSDGRVEGWLARVVVRLPEGRYLVLDTCGGPDKERPRRLCYPASLWMWVVSFVVAILALWLTARETRPLASLVAALRHFDGSAVTVEARPGAADIR